MLQEAARLPHIPRYFDLLAVATIAAIAHQGVIKRVELRRLRPINNPGLKAVMLPHQTALIVPACLDGVGTARIIGTN